MKLKQYLSGKAVTSFDVVRVEHAVTESTGEKIALLYLKVPIPVVPGSQTVVDEATGVSTRLEQYDVEVVKVFERDQDAEGINIEEDGTGTVNCDLRLDVSTAGDVWLTSESFAQFGRNKRKEFAAKRKSGIISKMEERKAANTFKANGPEAGATPTPEPVATTVKPKAGVKTS